VLREHAEYAYRGSDNQARINRSRAGRRAFIRHQFELLISWFAPDAGSELATPRSEKLLGQATTLAKAAGADRLVAEIAGRRPH
jgi:hypothetical protein